MPDAILEEQAPPGVKAMAIFRWLLLVSIAIIAATTIVYAVYPQWFSSQHVSEKILYTCPMHPEIISDHAGACPICGMDLVEKNTEEKTPSSLSGLSVVSLTPERAQLLGMQTATATVQTLPQTLRSIGFSASNDNLRTPIQANVAGTVGEVFTTQGTMVRKGEGLATITPRRHDTISIQAPSDGFVLQSNIVRGSQVQADTILFILADWSKMWINADVYEQDASKIQPGKKVRMTFLAYPKTEFVGSVLSISHALNEETRTYKTRIGLDNTDLKIRPGMYADIIFETVVVEGIYIPLQAVIDTGKLQYVFVVKDKNTFIPKKVFLGSRSLDQVQISDGINDGDEVLTVGNFSIDSESRMNAELQEFKHE